MKLIGSPDLRLDDDRGVAQTLRGHHEVSRGAIRLDALRPLDDRVRAITQNAMGRVALLWGLLAGLLFGSSQMFLRGQPVSLRWSAMIGLILVLGSIGRIWMNHRLSRVASSIRDAMVGDGVCACCGYSLSGLAVENDVSVVCPECGAAWNHDRVRQYVLHAPIPQDANARRMVSWYMHNWTQSFVWRRVDDDRGRPVGLITRRRILARGRVETGRLVERYERAARVLKWRGTVVRLAVVVFCFGPAVGASIAFPLAAIRSGTGSWAALVMIVFLPVFALLTIAVMRSDLGRSRAQITRVLLDEGLCSSCGAILDAEVEPDGCSVCDACGAAWQSRSATIR